MQSRLKKEWSEISIVTKRLTNSGKLILDKHRLLGSSTDLTSEQTESLT